MKESGGAVRSGPAAGEFVSRIEDPLQHLLNCHEQIERRLLTLQHAAMTLGFSEGGMLKDAAAALNYELEVLHAIDVLHTEDEEKSLFPRLRIRTKDNPSILEPLMLSLEQQHQSEQAAFERLKTAAKTINEGGIRPDDGSTIDDLVQALMGVCRPHIALENDSLFPLVCKTLTPSDLDEMLREMRQRWGMSQSNPNRTPQRKT
jgi:hemerythrin-like domain-containing protein